MNKKKAMTFLLVSVMAGSMLAGAEAMQALHRVHLLRAQKVAIMTAIQ